MEHELSSAIEVPEEQYTSVRFGVNKTLKKNKELKVEVEQLEERKKALEADIASLRDLYNQRTIEQNQDKQYNENQLQDLQTENSKLLEARLEIEKRVSNLESENSRLDTLVKEAEAKVVERDASTLKRVSEYDSLNVKYSELKQKYNELDELYNKKATSNRNVETTLAELSNQLNIKTSHMEKAIAESHEAKRQTMIYREENKNLRSKLEDKDKFIVKLNDEISDLGFRLENGVSRAQAPPEPVAKSQRTGASTPMVTTFTQPVRLSAPTPPPRGAPQAHTRSVPKVRRV